MPKQSFELFWGQAAMAVGFVLACHRGRLSLPLSLLKSRPIIRTTPPPLAPQYFLASSITTSGFNSPMAAGSGAPWLNPKGQDISRANKNNEVVIDKVNRSDFMDRTPKA